MLRLRPVLGLAADVTPRTTPLASASEQGVPMRTWASWTAKAALLAVGVAAAGGGLSGAALAVGGGGRAGSGAGLGSSAGLLITPTGGCRHAPSLPGVDRAASPVAAPASPPAAGAT